MGTDELAGPHERAARWQDIVNARPIPPRHLQRIDRGPVPVTAHIHWAVDGPQDVETMALDWVGRDVLVELQDDRWQVHGVWLDAADVTRRPNCCGYDLQLGARRRVGPGAVLEVSLTGPRQNRLPVASCGLAGHLDRPGNRVFERYAGHRKVPLL